MNETSSINMPLRLGGRQSRRWELRADDYQEFQGQSALAMRWRARLHQFEEVLFCSTMGGRAMGGRARINCTWRVAVLSILGLVTSNSTAFATDETGRYAWMGMNNSCGTFARGRDLARNGASALEDQYVTWLSGYLTAYNVLRPHTYDITGGADVPSLMLWLENYCKTNPLANFVDATNALTQQLYSERTKLAPR
jgi:hypothetical protein